VGVAGGAHRFVRILRRVLRMVPRPTFGPMAARRSRALARRAAPAALAVLGGADRWRLGEPFAGRGDTSVFVIQHDSGRSALLKAARSAGGRAELDRQVDVLGALHADPRLGGWTRLLPRTIGSGEVDGVRFVLESRLPGVDARSIPVGPERDRALDGALEALVELHSRTAAVVATTDEDLERWVREPVRNVRAVLHRAGRVVLDRVETELLGTLRATRLARTWVHGDYNAANVLIDAGRVTGIVDWCAADPDGPVALDATMLLLWENDARGPELGHQVLRCIEAPGRLTEVVADVQGRREGHRLDVRTVVLMLWLQHVGANLADPGRYAANPIWMHRNVRAVLGGL